MDKKLYFCVGCRQVHYDSDYNIYKDLVIFKWDLFVKSVNYVDSILKEEKQDV